MPDNFNHSPEGFISANKEIDVNQVMEAVKNRIRERKESGILKQSEIDDIANMELTPLPDFLEIPDIYQPHLYPGTNIQEASSTPFVPLAFHPESETAPGWRGIGKKILGKTRKVLFPLVRFMTRPIFNELKQLNVDLYNDVASKISQNTHDTDYYKRLSVQGKEYIKLMHNALNNLIVELSKLRIEMELTKSKLKTAEDKIEFLENRERAVEKKIFTQPDAHREP